MSSMGLFQSMFVHVYGCRNEAKFDTLYFHCINYIWFIVLADVQKMRKSSENFIPCGVYRLSRRHVLKRSDLAQSYHVTLSNKKILYPMKIYFCAWNESAHSTEREHILSNKNTFHRIQRCYRMRTFLLRESKKFFIACKFILSNWRANSSKWKYIFVEFCYILATIQVM